MSDAAEVTIEIAGADRLHIVRNMFTLFFADLAEFDPNLVINAHGLPIWAPTLAHLGGDGPRTHDECARANWWNRDRCDAYLILVGPVPAGFAHVLAGPHELPPGVDFELQDFYVHPKYRGRGIGARAARMVLDTRRGTWMVSELERNLAARAFWQKVIAAYTGGRYENREDGTQQRFSNVLQ